MVIKRFTSILGSKRNEETSTSSNGPSTGFMDRFRADIRGGSVGGDDAAHEGDTPEANAGRGVRLFCESGGPGNAGEEVLHLPVIVEAAESSPAAAAVAAKQIRQFLHKDNYARPHVQYNAVMLIRILADNPGPTFTRNMDSKFVSTIKEALRNCRDPSVQQILRETMQALYVEKAYDTNLQALFNMWGKEQGTPNRSAPNGAWQASQQMQQQAFSGPRPSGHAPVRGRLPAPAELAARIEEARTSGKLLQQLVQSTAPHELQSNDLVREFAERCQAAQRSMQQYINCDNPPPDDDTMQTLIETSEQLSLAASKHSRAVLQARRATTQQRTPPPETQLTNANGTVPPVASATFVPVGQPPAPAAPPSSAALYIPPPAPPPTMRANLDRRASQEYAAPTTPPRQRTGSAPTNKPLPNIAPSEPVELPTPSYDNPFSDKHEQKGDDNDDHDDLYNTSPTVPSRAPPIPTGYGTSASGTESYSPVPRRSPTRPSPQAQDSWRRPLRRPDSAYAPGYRSTPSYIRRQESSGENLTMHGAGIAEEPEDPVSPELERRERVGRGVGTVVGGSEVSVNAPTASSISGRSGRSGSAGDVSPIDTRSSAGYRYARQ